MSKLEDEDNNEPFDQFKGKQTHYNWEIYSTQLPDASTLTQEQLKRADILEKEIEKKNALKQSKHDFETKEELLYSAVIRITPKKAKKVKKQSL